MSAGSLAVSNSSPSWKLPSRGQIAMFCLITAESAIFTIFVIAYLFYLGKSATGPQPQNVLSPPVFFTICLLSSSITIHLATQRIEAGKTRSFALWWLLTILLGALFLFGTAREWHHLIYDEGLTIQTNLFGTTYYSLVGLHGFHVTVGLLLLLSVAIFSAFGLVRQEHAGRLQVLALYWHFVDAVWVVVFTVVYIIGR
jgi:cytochrome c oxidase subunit 3